jgi:hypothetical protein
VYVALVLWPADEVDQPPAEDEPTKPEPAPPPENPPPKPRAPEPVKPSEPQVPHFWLEPAGAVEFGLNDTRQLQGLVRLGIEQRFDARVSAIAFAAWPILPADVQVGSLRLDLARAPFGLGLRSGWGVSGLRAGVQVAFCPAWVRAERLDGQGTASSFEPGLSGGFVLALDRRVAPQLGVHLHYVPNPKRFSVAPTGIFAENPRIWVEATLGGAFGLW